MAVARYVCFSSLLAPPLHLHPPPRRNAKTYYNCKCNNSDKTLTQVTSSGVIACLRANR